MTVATARRLLLLLMVCGVGVARGADQAQQDDYLEDAFKLVATCRDMHLTICIKEKVLKYLDTVPPNLDLGKGFRIIPREDVKRSARYFNPTALPTEPRAREDVLDDILMDRLVSFLTTHTIQFKMPDESITEFKRSLDDVIEDNSVGLEEGRKKKKKGGHLWFLVQLKLAAIGAFLLKVIGAIAIKAFITAKIALAITTLIGLKKLLDSKGHHTSTYEVVAPHTFDDHHHYDRSFNAGELAYKAQLNSF